MIELLQSLHTKYIFIYRYGVGWGVCGRVAAGVVVTPPLVAP
jgi:hypothetical protein